MLIILKAIENPPKRFEWYKTSTKQSYLKKRKGNQNERNVINIKFSPNLIEIYQPRSEWKVNLSIADNLDDELNISIFEIWR